MLAQQIDAGQIFVFTHWGSFFSNAPQNNDACRECFWTLFFSRSYSHTMGCSAKFLVQCPVARFVLHIKFTTGWTVVMRFLSFKWPQNTHTWNLRWCCSLSWV